MTFTAHLPPAFRFAVLAANELLDLLCKERAGADHARKRRVPHDWNGATNRLKQQVDGADRYVMPITPALTMACDTPVTCCGVTGATAFHAVLGLARETSRALGTFHALTERGTRPLRIVPSQREALQPYLDALSPVPQQTCQKLVARMNREATRAAELTRQERAEPPEAVAKKLYEANLAKEYLAEIGASLTAEKAPALRKKRSTAKGDARAKIIGLLNRHHKYQDESPLNLEPICVNELSRQAKVGKSSVSRFLAKEFHGHSAYKAVCRDRGSLVAALKLLNGEFSPHSLYGRNPPDEGEPDEDE